MTDPAGAPEAPAPQVPGAAEVGALIRVMARLRADGGCPWDREQTWRSLRRYVLEEAHELVEAVDRDDPDAVLEECGDLLLEVVFVAQIAHEEGRFGMAEVARGITAKLIRRHPHVFGGQAPAADADEALASWEEIKAREKPQSGTDAPTLPRGLPALLMAVKALERSSARHGAAAPDGGDVPAALRRLDAARRTEDRDEVEAVLGDLLLAITREALRDGLDPESALRTAVRRLP